MLTETDLGFEYEDDKYILFFGKKNCTLDMVKRKFSKINFRAVKQTHSKIAIPSALGSEDIEADAHYTSENNVGLVIKTADCLPLLVHSRQNQIIAAIHAGWRGVENQITMETLRKLPSGVDYHIYIGPHILQQSFEVKSDVKDLILKSAKAPISHVAFQKAESYYIDLQKIVKTQIDAVLPQHRIFLSDLNTYKNPIFNSFRTDATKLRNISFIAQKMSPV